MRPLLLLALLGVLLYGSDTARLYNLYNKGEYERVCDEGFHLFSKNRKEEAFVALYGYACLNSDLLDRLATPIVMLKRTPDARKNAAYFSAILMKKKLLYHALVDGYDISHVVLPASTHILSKVFDIFAQTSPTPIEGIYTLQDPQEPKQNYKLYLDTQEELPKIIIESYRDAMLIKRHIYW
ncbi:MAG: hypothetical protein KU37_08835 [Sulfuricurvum sp. PC08-66]|nr:MAG: hypothetical protein KU37_08835 [Sulfuricurvum sp. PC08-66]